MKAHLPLLLLLTLSCRVVWVPEQLLLDGDDAGAEEDGADGEEDGADGEDSGGEAERPPLSGAALLTRLSLDLRGTRPSLAELAQVAEDPSQIDVLVEAFLQDSRWADRVAWTWNDAIHTGAWAGQYTRFGPLPPQQVRSLGAEPLRMVAAVAWEDRPFTDLVTLPQLRADRALSELWGQPAPAPTEPDGWGWVSPADGRPMAGVLSSTALWLRYSPDELSRNRVRANALARIFLCADFLEREGSFEFDVDLAALTDIEDAVNSQPACLSCHASLDPLASFFGGFTWRSEVMDRGRYTSWSPFHADLVQAAQPLAYYGVPAEDFSDLGRLVAADPRFARCAVGRFAEGLLGAPLNDEALLLQLTEDWVAAGMTVRPLVRGLVSLPAYRDPTPRVLGTEQLGASLMALLALPEEDPGASLSQGLSALTGSAEHRVLGGGTDDVTVLERNRSPGLGLQVLLAWAARTGAGQAVDLDLDRPLAERQLITVEPGGDEAARRANLAALIGRFLSEPTEADSPEVDRLLALWQASGGETGDETAAWTTVIEALIRHPATVLY